MSLSFHHLSSHYYHQLIQRSHNNAIVQEASNRQNIFSKNMGGSDDNELSLSSNIGGCGVIGAVYGGVKAAWALAPTGKYHHCHVVIYLNVYGVVSLVIYMTKLSYQNLFLFFFSQSTRRTNNIFRSRQHNWQNCTSICLDWWFIYGGITSISNVSTDE